MIQEITGVRLQVSQPLPKEYWEVDKGVMIAKSIEQHRDRIFTCMDETEKGREIREWLDGRDYQPVYRVAYSRLMNHVVWAAPGEYEHIRTLDMDLSVGLSFRDPADALMFKLTWGGAIQ